MTKPRSTPTILIVVLILIALIVVSAFAYLLRLTPAPTAPHKPAEVACTMEAKLCPDGSYVGRQGPNCDFAPCPLAQ